MLTTVQIFLL